ncbi:MAG: hypothetical protein K8I29_06315 [Alphaproteobacteria bacterium]|uniref:Uncharacterized protein n=1 Tax=Candidatus Nitrobium versatile TaxID=2884831 RepID=A0A953J3Y2_9BACT|nr:hypothetical protein [Candidatus Nitrobium versatile]
MYFCDLECIYASFPRSDAVDGSRSCRTFIALHCRLKKTLVHKNMPCKEKCEQKKPVRADTGAIRKGGRGRKSSGSGG